MKYCLMGLYVFFFTFSDLAQSTFVKAYIIQMNGDTIRGEANINPKKELTNYMKVTFKDQSGAQKIYKPNKVKGYGFNNVHFISYVSEGEHYFFNRLIGGEISLFKLGYEAMRMNKPSVEVDYFLSHASNNELIDVKEGRFKKQLTDWMKDHPDFIEEYGDDKKFDIEKAIEVITHYNAWKAEHTE